MKFYFLCLTLFSTCASALPKGFVYLADVAPTIKQELRYYSANNFVGRRITGYYANRCILTQQAASALALVQQELSKEQMSLIVYDCYRPQKAVNDFYIWSQNKDKLMKPYFYPREPKASLFDRGYIAKYSGHSRGSTIDLSIYKQPQKTENAESQCYSYQRDQQNSIDMGTNFDCLDPASYVKDRSVSHQAQENRRVLQKVMKKYNFKPYSKEWWHFTLRKEPFPKSYFNFEVK